MSVCVNRSLTAASGEMCFNSSTELRLAVSVDVDCVFTVYAPLGFKVSVNAISRIVSYLGSKRLTEEGIFFHYQEEYFEGSLCTWKA